MKCTVTFISIEGHQVTKRGAIQLQGLHCVAGIDDTTDKWSLNIVRQV